MEKAVKFSNAIARFVYPAVTRVAESSAWARDGRTAGAGGDHATGLGT